MIYVAAIVLQLNFSYDNSTGNNCHQQRDEDAEMDHTDSKCQSVYSAVCLYVCVCVCVCVCAVAVLGMG